MCSCIAVCEYRGIHLNTLYCHNIIHILCNTYKHEHCCQRLIQMGFEVDLVLYIVYTLKIDYATIHIDGNSRAQSLASSMFS